MDRLLSVGKRWLRGPGSTPEVLKAQYTLSVKPAKKQLNPDKIVKAFRAKCNISLEPLSPNPGSKVPVIDIREVCHDDELHSLGRESLSLPSNRLMVILISNPVEKFDDKSLLQLRWDIDHKTLKETENIRRVRDFIKTGRTSLTPHHDPNRGRFSESEGACNSRCYGASGVHLPDPQGYKSSDTHDQALEFVGSAEQHQLRVEEVTQHDYELDEDKHEVATGGFKRPTNPGTVYYGFDRDDPDSLLTKAVDFVHEEGEIKMERATGDVNRFTPLLVFCKNDTKLQEDVDNAKIQTRGGDDVMLIVLTDRKDQKLVDTETTKAFGQKVCLFWDYSKEKFRTTDNGESLVWIRDFLRPFQIRSSVKLSRKDSSRRTLEKFKTGKEEGWYHILSPPEIAEELQKSTLVYFHKKAIELQKAVQPFRRPLVLFSEDSEGLEQSVRQFQSQGHLGDRDVLVIVLYRKHQDRVFIGSRNTRLRLLIQDVHPQVPDIAENVNVVKTMKQFLNKNRSRQETKKEIRESKEDIGENSNGLGRYEQARTSSVDFPPQRGSLSTQRTAELSVRDHHNDFGTRHPPLPMEEDVSRQGFRRQRYPASSGSRYPNVSQFAWTNEYRPQASDTESRSDYYSTSRQTSYTNQAQSQRRQIRRPNATILPDKQRKQGERTLQKAGAKRAAEELLPDVMTSLGALSIAEKERKRDTELSNEHRKDVWRPQSRARRRNYKQ